MALLAVLALTACGADGEPEPQPRPSGGVSIFGTASIGVKGSL